jgi:hypothetical protein
MAGPVGSVRSASIPRCPAEGSAGRSSGSWRTTRRQLGEAQCSSRYGVPPVHPHLSRVPEWYERRGHRETSRLPIAALYPEDAARLLVSVMDVVTMRSRSRYISGHSRTPATCRQAPPSRSADFAPRPHRGSSSQLASLDRRYRGDPGGGDRTSLERPPEPDKSSSLRAGSASQVFAGSRTAYEDKDAGHRPGGSASVGHAFKTHLPHKSSMSVRARWRSLLGPGPTLRAVASAGAV